MRLLAVLLLLASVAVAHAQEDSASHGATPAVCCLSNTAANQTPFSQR